MLKSLIRIILCERIFNQNMKKLIQSVKGTRDYYPEAMALRNFLYQTVREVSESFGYQEWDAPFLETQELYEAKSGADLVKENFVFPDRGGDPITLRSELTPSLARLVAQRQKHLIYPLRWWSWGPFWRYERPQKGRTREFFQWNIDLIGVDSPEADAEIIAIAASFLRKVGISAGQVNIFVNNRELMETELASLEIDDKFYTDIFRLIDRRDKMQAKEWEDYALEVGLKRGQLEGLKERLEDNELWRKSPDLSVCFELIESLGLIEYVSFAPHIVRGLDYYTGTVFEAWDCNGEFRAILGGGRYDDLVSAVGGDPLPAVGFAMGDLVISLVLERFSTLPKDLGHSPAKVLVTVFDETTIKDSFHLASKLRQEGIWTAVYPEAAKLSKQFKYGDKLGLAVALVLGPDEQEKSTVTIKDLQTGDQIEIPQSELVHTVRSLLK
jgi:histidyl-tRNA synthetase